MAFAVRDLGQADGFGYLALWLDVVKLAATTRERHEDLIRLYITPTLASTPPGGDVGDPAPGDEVAPRQVV
jgi:hypothetical protein